MGHGAITDLEKPPQNVKFQGSGVDIDVPSVYNQNVGTLPNVITKGNWTVRSA
jgi:hypothetical protein